MTAPRCRTPVSGRPASRRGVPSWLAALAIGFAALALSVAVRAEDDLPARAGRVADVAGALSVAPADHPDQWEPANLNFTVIGGDNLWVAQDGRAEIDYGGGQFRLAGDTSAQVVRLDDRALVLFVAQGTAILRVRFLEAGDVAQVDTPNAQIVIARPGLYRIDVLAKGGQTILQVRDGEADVVTPAESARAFPGQTADVQGVDAARIDVRVASFTDAFDGWSASRDQYYDQGAATYVSRQMIGYADLDPYGSWQRYPEYGPVWFPSAVAVDWAPYRFGRWTWAGGFGWTWVDDAPWGYAPFHYGRWAFIGGRWGWCPGSWVARPAWAPALVAWYGGPSWSFSLSLGAPAYGWVPLAWGEPYVPAWGACSGRCWTAYNRPYAVRYAERPAVPPARYVNQGVPGGFTVVNRDTLVGGHRVSRAVIAVPAQTVSRAPMLGAVPADVRPAPGRIPGARPGGREPPPAASTFYPTRRASRPISTTPAATPAPFGTGTPGTTAAPARPGREVAVPPADGGATGRGGRSARPPGEVPAAGRGAPEIVIPPADGGATGRGGRSARPPGEVPAAGRAAPGPESAPASRVGSAPGSAVPAVPRGGSASGPVPPGGAVTRAPAQRIEPSAPAPAAPAPAHARPSRNVAPQGLPPPSAPVAPTAPPAPAHGAGPQSHVPGAAPAPPRSPQGQGAGAAPGAPQPPAQAGGSRPAHQPPPGRPNAPSDSDTTRR